MNPYYHALSSSRLFGDSWEKYFAVHEFIDSTKACYPDILHRLILHNTECSNLIGLIFGKEYKKVLYQHLQEDFGTTPSINDWFSDKSLLKKFYIDNHNTNSWKQESIFLDNDIYKFMNSINSEVYTEDIIFYNSYSPFILTKVFGPLTEFENKTIPTRTLVENIILARFDKIPTIEDWCKCITFSPGYKKRKQDD